MPGPMVSPTPEMVHRACSDGRQHRHRRPDPQLTLPLRKLSDARLYSLPKPSGSDVENSDSVQPRSEEHTSELQSLMRISYAVFCLKTTKQIHKTKPYSTYTNRLTQKSSR